MRSPQETWELLTSYLALNSGYDAFLVECPDLPARVLFRAKLKSFCEAHRRPFLEPLPEKGVPLDPLAWIVAQRGAWAGSDLHADALRPVFYLPIEDAEPGRETLRRLNEHRDDLRRELPGALYIAGLAGFLAWVPAEAPDFWSGRTWQCEFVPGPLSDITFDDSLTDGNEAALRGSNKAPATAFVPSASSPWLPVGRHPGVPPFHFGEGFFGRHREMETLSEGLSASGTVVLVGAAGVGKTRLAIEYASRHPKDYPGGVYWLEADRCTRDEALQKLAVLVHVRSPRDSSHVWDRVASGGRALVVLDGFESIDGPSLVHWLPLRRDVAVIVTARRVGLWTPGLQIEVPPLDEIDADALLRAKGVEHLPESLYVGQGNPMRLELAAGLDAVGAYTPDDDFARALAREGATDAIDLAAMIRRGWSSLSHGAQVIALMLAMSSPWTFRREVLHANTHGRFRVAPEAKREIDAALQRLGWTHSGRVDAPQFFPLHTVVAQCLVRLIPAEDPARIVAEDLQVELMITAVDVQWQLAAHANSSSITQTWRVSLNVARSLASALRRATLLTALATSFARGGRTSDALQIAREALENAGTANAHDLAIGIRALLDDLRHDDAVWVPGTPSDPDQAAFSLAEQEQALGPEHPDVIPPLLNLALALAASKRPEHAEALLQRARHLAEVNYGRDHPRVASVFAAQAQVHLLTRRSAVSDLAAADTIARARLPEDHPLRRWIDEQSRRPPEVAGAPPKPELE